jgi:DNA-binding PadR family transcriptional regulator
MPSAEADPQTVIPLTQPVFQILLALADSERHGYAIIKEVERRSSGKVKLSTGTLYAAIKRLLDDGLITETDRRPQRERDDERRRYYCLTAFGKKVARAEAHRMVELVEVARKKKLISGIATAARAGAR